MRKIWIALLLVFALLAAAGCGKAAETPADTPAPAENITKEIEETLSSTSLSLQEVAYKFGFVSQAAFCKFFMRQKGVSAKEFRKKV